MAQPSPRPSRLFILYVPHGLPWEHFDPVDAAGNLSFTANGIGGFASLEPYRQHVTVLRGGSMANGAHDHQALRALLTGLPEGGSSDSVDYRIARLRGVTPYVLGAVPYAEAEGFTVHSHLARHGGEWVQALESPIAAADLLLGPVAGTAPAAPPIDESAFETEALELTARQVGRLRQAVSGLTAEETKLSVHLQALENLRDSARAPQRACMGRAALPSLDALVGVNPLDETHFGHVFDAQLEVAANAMVCGTAEVVTLQTLWVRSDVRFDFLDGPGLAASHHLGLSHVVEPREPYARAQQWLFERLASKMLAVLDQPDPLDPGHTVLDNSLLYIASEVSDGSVHNSDSHTIDLLGNPVATWLPQVLIGGGAGYLKPGGRVVQLEENRPHTDVLATIAAASGAALDEIGGEPARIVEEVVA